MILLALRLSIIQTAYRIMANYASMLLLFLLPLLLSTALVQRDSYKRLVEYAEEYELPELPYPYDGLEPYVDEATLRVHHQGHHMGYAKKMNAALIDWREKVTRIPTH